MAHTQAAREFVEGCHDAIGVGEMTVRCEGDSLLPAFLVRRLRRPLKMIVTSFPIVDSVLVNYAAALGDDFIPYRNHVFRVVNLCLAVTGGSGDDGEKTEVAAAFHDLGIWTDHTFDYIAPSVLLARRYLALRSRSDWIAEVEAMIANHHKITRARAYPDGLVEGFRRADWIDVSCGIRRFGLERPFIRSLFATWPSAGFHWRLVEFETAWLRQHPLKPLPMVKL